MSTAPEITRRTEATQFGSCRTWSGPSAFGASSTTRSRNAAPSVRADQIRSTMAAALSTRCRATLVIAAALGAGDGLLGLASLTLSSLSIALRVLASL